MEFIFLSLKRAVSLILHPSAELLEVIGRSLFVSGTAVLLAALVALPLASVLAFGRRFALLRGAVVNISNTLMGLPPVVAGLVIYLVLSRRGPLGFMGLLYTPSAMVIAQFALALPIIAAISHAAIKAVDPSVSLASRSLGATPAQRALTVMAEARYGILAGVMAALGRVMAEVGAVLMVGGNIRGYTRIMTTTIALEIDKGEFELAVALGMVLLALSLLVNIFLYTLQKKGRRGWA